MIRSLWRWALAGLVVPGIVWVGAMARAEGSPADGLLFTFLYPTWLFVWLAMGTKSEIMGYVIMASTVVGNVAIFVLTGLVFLRLRTLSSLARWTATVVAYSALSISVIFIAYQYL